MAAYIALMLMLSLQSFHVEGKSNNCFILLQYLSNYVVFETKDAIIHPSILDIVKLRIESGD